MKVRGDVQEVEVEALILRADGTLERLGRVAYWHRNPLRRLFWRIKKGIRGNGY